MANNPTPHQIAARFNSKYKIGSKVRWRLKKGDPYREYTVEHAAFVRNGQAYAMFRGVIGHCNIDPLFLNYFV